MAQTARQGDRGAEALEGEASQAQGSCSVHFCRRQCVNRRLFYPLGLS